MSLDKILQTIQEYRPYGFVVGEIQKEQQSFIHLGLKRGKGYSELHSHDCVYPVTILKQGNNGLGMARKILFPQEDFCYAIDTVNGYALTLASTAPIEHFSLAAATQHESKKEINLDELYSQKLEQFFLLPNNSMTHFRLDAAVINEKILTSEGTCVHQSRIELGYEINVEVNNKELMVYGTANNVNHLDLHALFNDALNTATIVGTAQRIEPQQGPIVLHGLTAKQFFLQKRGGNPLLTQTSAEATYTKSCGVPLEKKISDTALTIESKLDGTIVDAFGTPMRPIILVKQGIIHDFSGSMHYVTWVNNHAEQFQDILQGKTLSPGGLGEIHVQPGALSEEEMLTTEGAVIIKAFSDLAMEHNGDICAEVRAGYVNHRGKKLPFSGNVLVGNLYDALWEINLSSEMMILDQYHGPSTLMFSKGMRLV